MQFDLSYYGKFSGDQEYLMSLPWRQFKFFYDELVRTKKKEKQAQESAQKARQASAASSKPSRHVPRARPTPSRYSRGRR